METKNYISRPKKSKKKILSAKKSNELPADIDVDLLRKNCPSSGESFLSNHFGDNFWKPWVAQNIQPSQDYILEITSSNPIIEGLEKVISSVNEQSSIKNTLKESKKLEFHEERRCILNASIFNNILNPLYEDITLESLDKDIDRILTLPKDLENVQLQDLYDPDVQDIMEDLNNYERLISKIDMIPIENFLINQNENTDYNKIVYKPTPKYSRKNQYPEILQPLNQNHLALQLMAKFKEDIQMYNYHHPTFIRDIVEDLSEFCAVIGERNAALKIHKENVNYCTKIIDKLVTGAANICKSKSKKLSINHQSMLNKCKDSSVKEIKRKYHDLVSESSPYFTKKNYAARATYDIIDIDDVRNTIPETEPKNEKLKLNRQPVIFEHRQNDIIAPVENYELTTKKNRSYHNMRPTTHLKAKENTKTQNLAIPEFKAVTHFFPKNHLITQNVADTHKDLAELANDSVSPEDRNKRKHGKPNSNGHNISALYFKQHDSIASNYNTKHLQDVKYSFNLRQNAHNMYRSKDILDQSYKSDMENNTNCTDLTIKTTPYSNIHESIESLGENIAQMQDVIPCYSDQHLSRKHNSRNAMDSAYAKNFPASNIKKQSNQGEKSSGDSIKTSSYFKVKRIASPPFKDNSLMRSSKLSNQTYHLTSPKKHKMSVNTNYSSTTEKKKKIKSKIRVFSSDTLQPFEF